MEEQTFIGRQPVMDAKQQIIGYEFFFRHSADAEAAVFEADIKNCASVLLSTIDQMHDEWKLGETEEELTVMKVLLHGEGKTIEYHLLDYYDAASQTSSMARTTGYTCTAAVNLLAKNLVTKKGVFPPELIGDDKACFDFVFEYLKERAVNWKKK